MQPVVHEFFPTISPLFPYSRFRMLTILDTPAPQPSYTAAYQHSRHPQRPMFATR